MSLDERVDNVNEDQNLLMPQVFFQNDVKPKTNTGSSTTLENPRNLKKVECRVEFVTFGEVDTFNEQFKAYVIIRSRWYEDGEITEYDPKKDWNPKLFIENAIPEKFYEEVRYKLNQQNDRTEITEIRSCKGTFWERMELPDFPLDIQELSIILQTKHNPKNVRLIPDTEKISRMNSDTLNSFRDQQKFKINYQSKYTLDKVAMAALIAFFISIQLVFAFTLLKSYQKIKKLQKEELIFEEKISVYPYDLEEYDD